MVLVFRVIGWARHGSSPGPAEPSGSSATEFNVSVSGNQ